MTLIDAVLLGYLVQTIDARISSFQVVFFRCLCRVNEIQSPSCPITSTSLLSLGLACFSPTHNCVVDFVSVSRPRPNLPNRSKVSIVQSPSRCSFFFVWVFLQTYLVSKPAALKRPLQHLTSSISKRDTEKGQVDSMIKNKHKQR